MAQPRHYSIVVVDIEGSGALNGPDKQSVRADLYRLVESALLESEVSPESVTSEDRGDGVYLLVDADVPIRQLIHPFVSVLDAGLAARTMGEPRLRLRLVVHDGQVSIDAKGSSGAAADLAFALVDAQQVRDALTDSPTGRIAVVLGDPIYQSVVCGHDDPDETAFRMRLLSTKRGEVKTWVTVTGTSRQPAGRSPVGHSEPAEQPHPAGSAVPVFQPRMGDDLTFHKVKSRGGVVGKVDRDANFGVDAKPDGAS
jgi:hypothetical protein